MSKPSNSPKKILLADDSVTMHRAVKLGLKKEPFDVICCDNGADAWRIVKDERPDAVLADLDMPGMTGAELCQKIKNDPELAHIPVILVCGSFDQIDEKHLEKVPSDARLWKPFETHVLISLLAKVLGSDSDESTSAEATLMGQTVNQKTSPTQLTGSGAEATAAFSSMAVNIKPPPPPSQKTRSGAEPTAFEATKSQHVSEPAIDARNVEMPSVSDSTDTLFEGFQDISFEPSPSTQQNMMEATELGIAGVGNENLWASDPVSTPAEKTSEQKVDTNWSSFDESEKSFSHEVFEAVETRNFAEEPQSGINDRSAFDATEVLGSSSGLQSFREETSQAFAPNTPARPPAPPTRSQQQHSTQVIPKPTTMSSMIDHSAAAAATAVQQRPGLSEEDVRKIIREEIQTAISGWLKNRLHDELERVIEEIDRE